MISAKRPVARRIAGGVLLAVLVALVAGAATLRKPAFVFTGAVARLTCVAIFEGHRDPDGAFRQDFHRLTAPGKYMVLARTEVNRADRSVTARILGLVPRKAIFREGLGCTTVEATTEKALRAQGEAPPLALPAEDPQALWPEGTATLNENLPVGIDAVRLQQALDRALEEPDPREPRGTRAIVVVHGGRIIGERYAPGFTPDTVHIVHSVTKSLTNAFIGILVMQGRLKIEDPAPVAEWREPGDPRAAITIDQLLRMSSGLQFDENYTKIRSDNVLGYAAGDLAGYAARKPLREAPGTRWYYSTGTSNLLGRIVRDAAGPDLRTAFAFPRRALFEPLGMRHAVIEVDSLGSFVGGSGLHISARDAARLGLLYLHDGVWQGRRILPEGWVAYTRTPTAHTPPRLDYGAHFWLNGDDDPQTRRWPKMPADAYAMVGHQGQFVVIVPSRDLVVVRFGLTEFNNWSIDDLVAGVIEALSPASVPPALESGS